MYNHRIELPEIVSVFIRLPSILTITCIPLLPFVLRGHRFPSRKSNDVFLTMDLVFIKIPSQEIVIAP